MQAMLRLLAAIALHGAFAMETSMLLQLQEPGGEARAGAPTAPAEAAPATAAEEEAMAGCWHWVTDKLWDGLAFPDQDGEDNFVGKMLNPTLGEKDYASGGAFSMDVSALTLAEIVGLSGGTRQTFRSDDSIEGWHIHERTPCAGTISSRNVTASCCNDVIFGLASFPKLDHVAIVMEAVGRGHSDVYTYYVFDPTFNTFAHDAQKRKEPRVLMQDLRRAGKILQHASGGMQSKVKSEMGKATYDGFRKYFISMDTFFRNGGDLRYPFGGAEAKYRTFKGTVDPTVCFGHGALLEKAAKKWASNSTSVDE